jgi:hypothetical protein
MFISASYTHLSQLPEDIWQRISDFLLIEHLARLYMCGQARLNLTLAHGGIRRVVIKFPMSIETLYWPKIVSHFLKLSHFEYNCGAVTSAAMYFPSQADLRLLGPYLETLILMADGAENAFFISTGGTYEDANEPPDYDSTQSTSYSNSSKKWFDNNPQGPLDIAQTWPKLHTLGLSQYSTYKLAMTSFQAFKPVLPTSLTRLDLYFSRHFVVKKDSLPPSLTHIGLRSSSVTIKDLACFPSGLLSIEIGEFLVADDEAIASAENPTGFSFGDAFPKLEHINFLPKTSDPSFILTMPPSLRTLDVQRSSVTSEWFHLMAMAPTLRLKQFKCGKVSFNPRDSFGPALKHRVESIRISDEIYTWNEAGNCWASGPAKRNS